MSEASLPPRPSPPRTLRDQAVGWFAWFGPVRIATTLVAVAVVAAGGFWLVRSPAPPTEAGLPVAAVPASIPASTLPPPSTSVAPTASSVPAWLVVHVAGAVSMPGVYRLAGDARVHTAVEAAGGATADADLDGLNLAAAVADGQRIYVPVTGEIDPASVPNGPTGASDIGGGSVAPAGPIDLNRATAEALESLPGIGPATAAAIVDDRDLNGPFASVDELDRVSGIGPAKLAAIRGLVTV